MGESNKLLLVVGPCSADRIDPVIDYVYKLADLQGKVSDKIFIIPRVYTNGYMCMIYHPDPQKKEDILEGIINIRKLHIKAIEESGLTSADELLYPEDFRYISDFVSYVAVAVRSVEN